MTSVLSAISGRLSRSLVVGTLIPVALFVVLQIYLVAPLLPREFDLIGAFEVVGLGTEWRALISLLLTVLLAGLVYGLNGPIIRLYEGYPWSKSPVLGRWRTERYKRLHRKLDARQSGIRAILRTMDPTTPGYDDALAEWELLADRFHNGFPKDRRLVLPTRLGNIIRCFEEYPYRQYRIEAIALWPRLVGQVDEKYATSVDETKASFDLMLNGSLLSMILTLEVLALGLGYGGPFAADPSPPWWLWAGEIIGLTALSFAFYRASFRRAQAWGATVMAAFDLYRWELLRQLGYKHAPSTVEEERTLWDNVSNFLAFGAEWPRLNMVRYTGGTPSAAGDEPGVELTVVRGISEPEPIGSTSASRLRVTLRLLNSDARGREAPNVVVTDEIPEGYEYEWGSASVAPGVDANRGPRVIGTNPLRLAVGGLAARGWIVLGYSAISPNNGGGKDG